MLSRKNWSRNETRGDTFECLRSQTITENNSCAGDEVSLRNQLQILWLLLETGDLNFGQKPAEIFVFFYMDL